MQTACRPYFGLLLRNPPHSCSISSVTLCSGLYSMPFWRGPRPSFSILRDEPRRYRTFTSVLHYCCLAPGEWSPACACTPIGCAERVIWRLRLRHPALPGFAAARQSVLPYLFSIPLRPVPSYLARYSFSLLSRLDPPHRQSKSRLHPTCAPKCRPFTYSCFESRWHRLWPHASGSRHRLFIPKTWPCLAGH